MNTEEYIATYNQLTENTGKNAAGAEHFRIEKELLVNCGYKAGMSLLDYGCGWGSLLTVIDDYGSYLGVDISPFMINLAKDLFPNNLFEINYMGTLKTKVKDIIVAHSVFTHIPKNLVKIALLDIKSNLAGFAVVDIFYNEPIGDIYENYQHEEWETILQEVGLVGTFIKSRIRAETFTHQYYKIELI